MTPSNRGYSSGVVKQIKAADQTLIGVQLGVVCVDKDIAAQDLARELGVTRSTVYYWFKGQCVPCKSKEPELVALLERLRAQ